MINEQLMGYVATERARGVADDAIRGALLAQGWKVEDVASAMGGMTAGSVSLVGEMGVFELLSATWRNFIGRINVYAVFAALPILATVITFLIFGMGSVGIMSLGGGMSGMMMGMMGAALGTVVIMALASFVATSALIIALSDSSVTSPSVALTKALSVFLKYAVVSFVTGVIIGVGFLLLIIPGIYLLGKYGLAPIIAIAEGKGLSDALSASSAYTDGKVWGIAWKLIIGTIVVSILVSILTGVLTSVSSMVSPMLSMLVSAVANGFMTMFVVIYMFLCYKNISGRA